MMQYEHGSSQPVCTRSVNAVRPATPGSIAAPQLPVAVAEPTRRSVDAVRLSRLEPIAQTDISRGLSSFGTTLHDVRAAPATSSGRRVA